jgi:hypothetical protein
MLSHHLATCDFRVAVELAARQSSIFRLITWANESDCRRSPITVLDGTASIAIVPDGTFTLGLVGVHVQQTFRVEIDRATNVSPTRMKLRMRGYLIEGSGGRTVAAPVLFVVPTRERQATIARWAAEEAEASGSDPTLFWITTASLVSVDTALDEPIWEIVGVKTPVSIRSLAAPRASEPLRGAIPRQGVVVG